MTGAQPQRRTSTLRKDNLIFVPKNVIPNVVWSGREDLNPQLSGWMFPDALHLSYPRMYD